MHIDESSITASAVCIAQYGAEIAVSRLANGLPGESASLGSTQPCVGSCVDRLRVPSGCSRGHSRLHRQRRHRPPVAALAQLERHRALSCARSQPMAITSGLGRARQGRARRLGRSATYLHKPKTAQIEDLTCRPFFDGPRSRDLA